MTLLDHMIDDYYRGIVQSFTMAFEAHAGRAVGGAPGAVSPAMTPDQVMNGYLAESENRKRKERKLGEVASNGVMAAQLQQPNKCSKAENRGQEEMASESRSNCEKRATASIAVSPDTTQTCSEEAASI